MFDNNKYLRSKNIYNRVDVDKIYKTKDNKNILYKLKRALNNRIKKLDNTGIMYSFILGDNSLIKKEDKENFRINGVSHLFALSGMHVSFLCFILFKIMSLFRVEEKKKYYITLIFLLIFSFLTGNSPSILRSILFFFLYGIFKLKRIKVNDISVLLISLDIILIIFPYKILSTSLILSFVVSFFLLYFQKENTNYIKNILHISLISFFSSLPIIINMNYEINILSIINNLIFVPLVSLIVFPLTVFTCIFPFLNKINKFFINILLNLNRFISSFKITLIFSKISIILIIIYYLILLIFKFKKNNIFKIIFISYFIFLYIRPYIDNNYYIYFLNVGQGDSTLIIEKNMKKVILVDTGGLRNYDGSLNENLPSNMIKFFKSIGIKKINYLFLTHNDFDHIGNTSYLNNYFDINKIIYTFNGYIKNKYLNIKNLNKHIFDNDNENSMILYLNIYKYKILLMGDATYKNEEYLLNEYNLNNIDIIKLGHHGSNTSSSLNFIKKINQVYSVISVGKNNKYNHPSKEVLENIKNSKVYRTDIDGTIMFKINKHNIKVRTFIN